MNSNTTIRGNLVDVHQQLIYPAEILVKNERIEMINRLPPDAVVPDNYIMPGFIDAHVHIESSMLVPSEFARLAVVHGTVATISDPHEIANVCGMQGVEYMIDNGNKVPFKFYFGAPSCVPATAFETAGAVIDAGQVDELLRRNEILYLSEMMNFPGVLNGDADVMKKIASAKKHNKPVDGHAPGLTGDQARQYISAGISTDHECFTREEALDKIRNGMQILVREGSAARNFNALVELLDEHADMMMFCSDDKHPDSLVESHINALCARAIAAGTDLFKILKAACINPVLHYKLKVGLLRQNDFADFIVVKDLKKFEVIRTYINGQLVAENGKTYIAPQKSTVINQFHCKPKLPEDFLISKEITEKWLRSPYNGIPVIEALDEQLITRKFIASSLTLPSVQSDILKIAVVNRYRDAPVALAFIKNFGLKKGAIASSVAHDSHNIVAVGTDDDLLCRAVNLVIESKGGISCVEGKNDHILALPVAGLMSTEDGYQVAEQYAAMDRKAKELGSKLSSPFMTLSFMALLVIPHLKLSDLGLFDGDSFRII